MLQSTVSGLKAICIGDVTSLTDKLEALCADLDEIGGVAFKDLHNVDGDHRLEISEFPYDDALWNAANTNAVRPIEFNLLLVVPSSIIGPLQTAHNTKNFILFLSFSSKFRGLSFYAQQ